MLTPLGRRSGPGPSRGLSRALLATAFVLVTVLPSCDGDNSPEGPDPVVAATPSPTAEPTPAPTPTTPTTPSPTPATPFRVTSARLQESDGYPSGSAPCPQEVWIDAFVRVTAPGTVRYRIRERAGGTWPTVFSATESVDGPGEKVWRKVVGKLLPDGGSGSLRLEVLEPNDISAENLDVDHKCSNAQVTDLTVSAGDQSGGCPMNVVVGGRITTDMYADVEWAMERRGLPYGWHSTSIKGSDWVLPRFDGVRGSFEVRLLTRRPSVRQSPWYKVSVTCTP